MLTISDGKRGRRICSVPDYKLIALDIDGTLLTSQRTISARTRRALANAVERGVTLTIATGRRRRTAKPIVEQLDLPHYLVVSQGAAVWQDGQVIHHSHLPRDAARDALEIIRAHGLCTAILSNALLPEHEEVIWADGNWRSNPRLADYLTRNQPWVRDFEPAALAHDPIEFIVMDDLARLEALDRALTGHPAPPPAEDAPAQPGPRPEAPRWRVIFSRNQFTAGGAIEVVGPATSKAAALQVLCDRLGITRDEVMAFGDNVNDVEMLEFAGLGVAMGNATDDVKALIRRRGARGRITAGNDEDGIALVLEQELCLS